MVESRDNKRIIRLPADVNLYETVADGFVRDLIVFAEKLHRMPHVNHGQGSVRGILVLQTAPASDRTRTWLRELEDEALLFRLADRIDDIRWLLSLIRHSPVPWMFAAANDCLGSVWELALSCQKRYWFSGEARLGFPDIEGGAFPPGGVLESMDKRLGRTKERWLARPLLSAEEAVLEGFVDFCSESMHFEETAVLMFDEVLAHNPRSGVREGERKKIREPFDIESGSRARRAVEDQLEAVWRGVAATSPKTPSTWDYCWQLVKEQRSQKKTSTNDLGRLIAHIVAHHYLSPAYRSWLASGAARNQAVTELGASALQSPVTIDLNFVAPPTEVLVRLLNANVPLVFISNEAKSLASSLNMIYSRLERAISPGRAETLWTRFVSWCQGVCDNNRGPTLRWGVDDRFIMQNYDARWEYLRIEGNSSHAKAGMLEWTRPLRKESLTPELGNMERGLLHLVANGWLETHGIGRQAMPISFYLRSLALEELVNLARFREGDIDAVVEGLNQVGWLFAGQEHSWERFVRARIDAFAFDDDLVAFGDKGFSRSLWEAGAWKHVKSYARRNAGAAEPAWNATAISQHLAIFIGLAVLRLVQQGVMDSLAAADYLAAKALGFPIDQGTPLHFLRCRGRRRVEHYVTRHWPSLEIDSIWLIP